MRYGGIIHSYQKYDPGRFPSPTQPPTDLLSSVFDYYLAFGDSRELTEEQLARAIRIDPSQLAGFGPSIDALIAILLERKRKILEKYSVKSVLRDAQATYQQHAKNAVPPAELRKSFKQAVQQEQIPDFERIWYQLRSEASPFARPLMRVIESLGNKFEIEELAAKYEFTGRERLSIERALEVKQELDKIEELLKQLEEARKTAQIGLIDMEALAEFTEPGDLSNLSAIEQQIRDYMREMAGRQGLESDGKRLRLTPQALRMFQGQLLERIFSHLKSSRTGRHEAKTTGDGAVETMRTRPYEFGDSITHMDVTESFTRAILRDGPGLPVRLIPDDIVIHQTKNNPKCATAVVMDMSGSMRYDGQYMNVKRMALALDGLITREYPGDFLGFIEMYTFARICPRSEIINLLPKPVTIHDPWVRLRADMSREDISEYQIHPHFTNIQHGLQLARQLLSVQATPNRNVILITDGLPTAHFEGTWLYMLYPPATETEQATMREAHLCTREGITINIFLVPSWSQSETDIQFAYRLAETTRGRVFFTAGRDLDRCVLWDYLARKREIIG